jgi:phage terminase large subunit-like protein
MESIRRREEERIRYFIPNEAQEQFIKAIQSETETAIFSAANACGKTAAGVNMIGNMFYGPQNEWFETDFFRKFKRPSRGRIISEATTIEQKIVPELKKWLKAGTYVARKLNRPFESYWKLMDGTEFDLLTNDQDKKEFESVDLDWIWEDEPPRRDIHHSSIARLRFGGIVIITFTPLKSGHFIFDDYQDREDGKKIIFTFGDIEQNCFEHSKRGIIPHSTIIRWKAEYDPDEAEARLHGKPQSRYGRIHKLFDREKHLISELPANEYTWYFVLDPHERRPPAMIWVAVNPSDICIVVDEWPNERFDKLRECSLDYDGIVKLIKAKEEDMKINVEHRVIDPHCLNNPHSNTSMTIYQEYKARGIKFDRRIRLFKGFEDVAQKKLDSYLSLKPNPMIYMMKNCRNVIYSLENWTWDDYEGKLAERMDIREHPSNKHKCFSNLLEYLVMAKPEYRTNTPPATEQLIRTEDDRGIFGKTGY